MKQFILGLIVFVLSCLLAACTTTPPLPPTVTPQSPTVTQVPPSKTPTQVPTPTETSELVLPRLAGTPITPSVPLGPGNAAQVTELARWEQESDPSFNHDMAFFSPDGRFIAVSSSDGIHLYNANTLTQARLIKSSPATGLAFSPNGMTLAVGSPDNTIQLWNVGTGLELRTLIDTASVEGVAFSPDGRTLASSSGDNKIKLWNVATGQELHILNGSNPFAFSLAFSPDGRMLAAGSDDSMIKLWDVASGLEITTLGGSISVATSLAFSPDGRMLASGVGDDSIQLWDIASRQKLHTMNGYANYVGSVAFSPDGTILASSGSYDYMIRLWNVTTGQELRALSGDTLAAFNDVVFSPDGRTLVSASDDGTICIWGVPLASSMVRATSTAPSTAAPEPTQMPLPTLQAGRSITLTSLQMVDTAIGWGSESTGHIVRTTDGGQSWTDVTPPNLPADIFGSFFLNAQLAWIYDYNHPENGLVRTADGGKTWTRLTQSLPTQPDFMNVGITFFDENNGWLETGDPHTGQVDIGIFATHDGGVTWNQVTLANHPGQLDDFPGTLHLCNMCRDAFFYNPGRLILFFGDLSSNIPVGSVNLSYSTNLGKTWEDQTLPLPPTFAGDNVSPLPPVFFNEKDGLLPFGVIKFNTDMTRDYEGLAVYVTHDGGLTWIPNSTVVGNVDVDIIVDFVSQQDIFAGCGNDLCASHDGANTWQMLHSNLNFGLSCGLECVTKIGFVNPTTGWAITTDGTVSSLWKSVDGGASWIKLSPMLIH